MNRHTLPVLISLVLLGVAASFAATTNPSTESPLTGKAVVVSQPGVIHGMHENARFVSVGQTDFIVVPMQHAGTTVTYDYWIPLKDVTLLQVFNSKENAEDYIEKRDSKRQSHSDQ